MIIAIGMNIQPGPFGGGNQFGQTLKNFLEKQGHEVVFDLQRPNIDIILVTSVKPWGRGTAFDIVGALQYASTHPQTKVVLRINECDQRKGYKMPLLNNLLRASMKQVDYTVFVSQWLGQTLKPDSSLRSSVIHSGADPVIFNSQGRVMWDGHGPLKIVTHHWSRNWYKGWDVYKKLEEFVKSPAGKQYQFSFIGPPHPLVGLELARTLKEHHVYISASQNEPAGMHYIEALQCGLPVLYRHSGSLPEYCAPYGLGFNGPNDVIAALERIRQEYQIHHQTTQQLRYTADDMNRAYLDLFKNLPGRVATRQIFPLWVRQGFLWLRDTLDRR